MGRRGPAPTPTKVKILHGETRPSRLNYREPIPSSDVPKMPADMDAEAKVVWRRVISSMGHLGVIRVPDADILRCYCEAVSRYAQAARLYAGSGPLVRHPGGLVKNPLHQVIGDDSDQIRMFARELGAFRRRRGWVSMSSPSTTLARSTPISASRRVSGRSPMGASSWPEDVQVAIRARQNLSGCVAERLDG